MNTVKLEKKNLSPLHSVKIGSTSQMSISVERRQKINGILLRKFLRIKRTEISKSTCEILKIWKSGLQRSRNRMIFFPTPEGKKSEN